MEERIKRATAQRIFVMEKTVLDDAVKFVVMGTTGTTFNVKFPEYHCSSCTCADFAFNGRRYPCKHILYVMIRVLKCDPRHMDATKLMYDVACAVSAPTPTIFDIPTENAKQARVAPFDPSEDCPICYSSMDPEMEKLYSCHQCLKYYHRSCIKKWTQRSRSCPMCRAQIKV